MKPGALSHWLEATSNVTVCKYIMSMRNLDKWEGTSLIYYIIQRYHNRFENKQTKTSKPLLTFKKGDILLISDSK